MCGKWGIKSLHAGKFASFSCRLVTFLKLTLSKNSSMNSFRNNIRVSYNLDPDQDRLFVGPELGSNCLQKISADDKICR